MAHSITTTIALVLLALFSVPTALAEVVTRTVVYQDGDVALEGYLAYDPEKVAAAGGQVPGVILVHQWRGITDHEREWSRKLAEEGYVAFAADIYGQGVRASTRQEAGQLAGKYRGERALFRSRLHAALDRLRAEESVATDHIATIGFCFGGTGALEMARSGADVAAVVSFHGGLGTPTPEDAKQIKGKVLVLHGADDPAVPEDEVLAFFAEMREAEVDWHFVAYGNAVHSFTDKSAGSDNSAGSAYNADADRRSWQHMLMFFREVFGQ